MITRRKLVLTLGAGAGALAAPFLAIAQPKQRIYRVGILGTGSPAGGARLYDGFTHSLHELGYVDGKNIAFERRFADGNLEKLPALAAELAAKKVDIVFAPGSPAVLAMKQAAATTPVVFAVVTDPVSRGFVASLEKPGGHITGITSVGAGIGSKRLQLFKEAFPKLSRVALVITREPNVTPLIARQISEMHAAAKTNGLEILPIEIRSRNSFADATDVLRRWHADGISCLDTAVNFFNRDMLIEFSATMKLPAIYTSREFVDSGGLMSYGANTERSYRRAATYIDKILKGARPAELAVEVPTQHELAINQKTARALGFNLPDAIVQKADKLIG